MKIKFYEPFGHEWEKEMSKMTKTYLNDRFGVSGVGITKAKQIQIIKKELQS